ncbi:FolB domain-containing protein [Curvibacter sp. CHRR-16]|uniref:FolB domain-containing protein n=1 Tax=Curvibacter sp. CHRR-16 TaxID=2835872 RepID=UPI001BD97F9A|nr:FolB domain-containing protein [Curvibacter sp. CHRR-16]MBT0568831.1 FolB domain-containing protein [Curvibacter sp. CHRR-16]
MDKVKIENLEINCSIGRGVKENLNKQRVLVDVELFFETERAANSESLDDAVDFTLIAQQIAFVLQVCSFTLLEVAAHTIAKMILMPPAIDEKRAQVEKVHLVLHMPEALKSYGGASVEITRNALWAKYIDEEKPFGKVKIIHETMDFGLYRLSISPGNKIPMHEHRVMDESEFILTDGVQCQHLPAPVGSVRHWPKFTPHVYENLTNRWQSLLCIDRPKFMHHDEVLVSKPAVDVPLIPGWFS